MKGSFLLGGMGGLGTGTGNWKYLKKYVWILLNWDLNIFIFFVCLYVLNFFIKRNIYFESSYPFQWPNIIPMNLKKILRVLGLKELCLLA